MYIIVCCVYFTGRKASEKIDQINMYYGTDGSPGCNGNSIGDF